MNPKPQVEKTDPLGIYHSGKLVEEVILHTSATPGDWWVGKNIKEVIAAIDGWHKAGGWKCIGYHRVVMPDGTIGVGRSLYEQGAHVAGHNRGTIGICMIPIRTHKGIKTFEAYFTPAQKKAVKEYIQELSKLTSIKKVTGHNQYASKECPGFRVNSSEWL